MSNNRRVPFPVYGPLAENYSGLGIALQTLSGTLTMTALSETLQSLDGGVSNRDVVLPTAKAQLKGVTYRIYNRGATNSLVVKDVASTVATLAVSETGFFTCDGANWKLGGRTAPAVTTTGTANTWALLQTFTTGALIQDAGYVGFGTPGTDLVLTADGTDVIVTSTGDLVFNDSVDLKIGTGKDIGIAWDGTRLNVTQALANSEIRWGVDGAGIDQILYGDTAGVSATWDQSRDTLRFSDNALLGIGSGAGAAADIEFKWDATDLLVTQLTADSTIKWGVSGAGINHVFYGDTAGYDLSWDQTGDQLLFADNAKLAIGSGGGAAGDMQFYWDGTRMIVAQLTANSAIRWGADGAGIDHVFYGDTAGTTFTWDQSADTLLVTGVAKIKYETIAAATGTAIPVTHSGSFPITQNGAETNTLADPTYIGQWLSIFVDTDTSGARVITAASRINQAGNTIITLTEVGDFIKLEAITIAGALKWQVVANDGAALS